MSIHAYWRPHLILASILLGDPNADLSVILLSPLKKGGRYSTGAWGNSTETAVISDTNALYNSLRYRATKTPIDSRNY